MRTGCSWRNLPKDLPDWQAVYSRFRRWKVRGLYDRVYELLTKVLRGKLRKEDAKIPIVDSQSVKIIDRGGEHGYDAIKKSMVESDILLLIICGIKSLFMLCQLMLGIGKH